MIGTLRVYLLNRKEDSSYEEAWETCIAILSDSLKFGVKHEILKEWLILDAKEILYILLVGSLCDGYDEFNCILSCTELEIICAIASRDQADESTLFNKITIISLICQDTPESLTASCADQEAF